MSEVTNTELLQAVKDLSNDVNKVDGRIATLENEMKDMKTELKQDICKPDQKFTTVLEDLIEARTDINILQKTVNP